MKTKIILGAFVAIILVTNSAWASFESLQHRFVMKGRILEVNGDEIYFCIGAPDMARVGQELTIYRYVRNGNLSPKTSQRYDWKKEGRLKILRINGHMADAQIMSGSAKAGYLVKLN